MSEVSVSPSERAMVQCAAVSKKPGSVRGQSSARSHESASRTNISRGATSRESVPLGSRRSSAKRMNLDGVTFENLSRKDRKEEQKKRGGGGKARRLKSRICLHQYFIRNRSNVLKKLMREKQNRNRTIDWTPFDWSLPAPVVPLLRSPHR